MTKCARRVRARHVPRRYRAKKSRWHAEQISRALVDKYAADRKNKRHARRRVATFLAGLPLAAVDSSPLERATHTAQPSFAACAMRIQEQRWWSSCVTRLELSDTDASLRFLNCQPTATPLVL